jgi:iron complex outermembrane receptor protein
MKITKTKLFLFLLLSLSVNLCVAQSTTVESMIVKGKISNAKGEPVIGANIQLLNSNLNTSTDNQGNFRINVDGVGQYSFRVSALNYQILIQTLRLQQKETNLNVKLESQGTVLEEVVVTGQKRDERAQELPLSISILSETQVQNKQILNTKDLTAIIPNLYAAHPGDNRNVTSIRGMATTSYEPTVATYIDGVSQFGLDTYMAQLQDIERIEVLRGPQGTLYGRNAMGGVINIITRQPRNTFKGFAEISFANFNQQRFNAGFSLPIIKDKLFFSAAGLYTKQDGFYKNIFTKTSFDDQNSMMGNYNLRFLASSKLSLSLNVKHVTNSNQGTFPLAGSFQDAIATPFVLSQNSVAKLSDQVTDASLIINYTGSAYNFTAQSAYQSNYRYYKQPVDADFSPIDGYAIVNNYGKEWNNVKVFTQEVRFSSAAASLSPLKWVAGTYFFHQDSPVKQGTHIGADGLLVGAPFPNFTSINTNVSKNYGAALFGQATYNLNPKVAFTFGLRYDYEHKKQNIKGEFQPDGADAIVTQADSSASANFSALTPKVGIQYQIGSNSHIYGSYSRGFRAGGISQLSANPQEALVAYNPEFSNGFEIGSKNTFFNNKIRLNIALFYTLVNNAQVPTLVLPDALTLTINAGKLRSRGAELELAIVPLKDLEINYNVGFTNAKYTSLYLPNNGSTVNYSGNHQIFTPKATSMLGLQYSYRIGNDVKLTANAEWRYIGKQYFDLTNQLVQNGYHLLNSRFGILIKRIEIAVWGTNIGNKKYVDYAYDFGAAHLGNPKIYGISTKVKF